MNDWLPGYQRDPVNAGLNWTPNTPWKVVLHSTETGPAPGLIGAWRNNPGSGCPHFLGITPDRIVQLLPFSVGAYTLQNPEGGVDTNRAHAIQIEVCAYAKDAPSWCGPGAPWTNALGQWLADLVHNGINLDLTTELDFGGQWTGFPGGGNAYVNFSGVLGHQHVPEQPDRHWDPGRINIKAVLEVARSHLGSTQPPTQGGWDEMATQSEVKESVKEALYELMTGTDERADKFQWAMARSVVGVMYDENLTGKTRPSVTIPEVQRQLTSSGVVGTARGAIDAIYNTVGATGREGG